MWRRIIALSLALASATASQVILAATPDVARRIPSGPIDAAHPVLGRWQLALLDGDCFEDMEFSADGIRTVTSGPQKLRARYTISPEPDDLGFYSLTDTILWTNGSSDCGGRRPQTGNAANGFVKFNSKLDELFACTGRDVTSCWGPYVKKSGISAQLWRGIGPATAASRSCSPDAPG